MNKSELINFIIKKINAKKYLEIGVYEGDNFKNIVCENKVGVDPDINSKATVYQTSDNFFKENKEKHDIILIDGLHHADQVYRDIINSLSCLNENGYIICHDMNPEKEEHQTIPYRGGIWNGDCWKAFVNLRQTRDDLEMYVIDTDYGCGIIKKGSQELLPGNFDLTWDNFVKNRSEWLNLISVDRFLSKFNLNPEFVDILQDIMFNKLIYDYVEDPEDYSKNYNLGSYYESMGQTASAVSYYLRAAERTSDELIQYECLLRSALCFEKQGCRNFTVKGLLLHALSILPKRPEAYYLLSRFYEKENKDGSWQECYTIASIGNSVADLNSAPLTTDVGYSGNYVLLFQKAVSSWWCGLCKESNNIFKELLAKYDMKEEFKNSVINNLNFFESKNKLKN
jgi:tetratricopeptide (TPR) repeat protein